MIEIVDTKQSNKTGIDAMREEFGKAKAGDIIKIKRHSSEDSYLLVSKANNFDNGNKKCFAVTNLNSKFTWRLGATTLEESFDIWFMNNGKCSLLDLEVINDIKINVVSTR